MLWKTKTGRQTILKLAQHSDHINWAYVTDFGVMNIQMTQTLRTFIEMAEELDAERFLFFWKPKNPPRGYVTEYLAYIERTMELCYVRGVEHQWRVDVMDFDTWLGYFKNGDVVNSGRKDQGSRREEKGNR